ncbi:MAG TPA: histidine phosphatase family protein [Candidatus Marinimicrobia bacterium]|nr:histidine phosphatase family protein [Candidatus Neomarinimicrobiota bacterium]
MKSVILFRHGKSDWDAVYNTDHNRPLAKRGIKAAKRMGKYLADLDQMPDLVISSTAVRAKTTVQLAMESGEWSSEFKLDRSIYGGASGTLLDLLYNINESVGVACLVGHEPTFSSFISNCTNSGWIRFPTASMARLDFEVSAWKEIRFGQGTLAWLTRPKELH